MNQPQFKIGIKNNVTNDMNDGVCELSFLTTIDNPTYYDWESGEEYEGSLLANVIDQIKYYNPKKIRLNIDNLGGNARVGWGIYNYLITTGCKIETNIISSCGSISTVIAFSGDDGKIKMPKYGLYGIHQAENYAQGRASDLRAAADLADKNTKMMLDLYVAKNRKGKTFDELAALIADGDFWMTGEEAKEMGFVDDCYEDASITVTASLEKLKTVTANIPQRLLDMQAAEVPAETESKTLIQHFMELKSFVTAAFDKIKSNKVDSKSTNLTGDIAEAIAQPLNDMVEGIQNEVTAELGRQKDALSTELTTTVTTAVTAAMELKYNAIVEGLEKKVTDLTADLEKQAGKESTAAGIGGEPKGRSLSGKFAGEA